MNAGKTQGKVATKHEVARVLNDVGAMRTLVRNVFPSNNHKRKSLEWADNVEGALSGKST